MPKFNSSLMELLNFTERMYKFELTLGEKMALKENIIISRKLTNRKDRTLTGAVAVGEFNDAWKMLLIQYGIGYSDKDEFPIGYENLIREARESCLLL